jgi:hypothetical protein
MSQPLRNWEKVGLAAFLLGMLLFGAVVEMRSVFLKRHMTDLDVYLRTAWAVRAGPDIYDITDDNCWHYQYPPLLAILLTPLADPPPGADRTGMLPFGASVALWYVLGLLCAALAVHQLASALAPASAGLPAYPCWSRGWWGLRVLPIVACIVPIGHTLMRGQVNLLILLCLCGMTAAILRRQSFRAGLWLSGAIGIKVIPAFLLIVPIWRRDVRCLAGCLAGLIVGMALIPTAVFGPVRTLQYYREYADKLLWPGLGEGADQSRAKELIDMTANDSQSLLAVMHNLMHFNRDSRPTHASAWLRALHWLLGVGLTLAIVAAYGRSHPDASVRDLQFIGGLIIVMLLVSPICHLHYFCLCIPAIMGMLAASWSADIPSRSGLVLAIGSFALAMVPPNLPGFEMLRDVGLATSGALVLWMVACLSLVRTSDPAAVGRPIKVRMLEMEAVA